jgi:hypothetical protein
MQDLVTVLPFALMGVAMVVFGLVLNRQGTLSARRLDAMTADRSLATPEAIIAPPLKRPSATSPDAETRTRVETHS